MNSTKLELDEKEALIKFLCTQGQIKIKNNKFFLLLYDGGLMGVDLRDPNLPKQMKMRVLRECMVNYW